MHFEHDKFMKEENQNSQKAAGDRPAADGSALSVTYPATLIVHTPSGLTAACEKHAAQIKALMAFMGAHTNATLALDGAECSNCRNESKKPTRLETVGICPGCCERLLECSCGSNTQLKSK